MTPQEKEAVRHLMTAAERMVEASRETRKAHRGLVEQEAEYRAAAKAWAALDTKARGRQP